MFGFKKRSEPQSSNRQSTPKLPQGMANGKQEQGRVNGSGSVTVRQRPSLLLMKFPFRVAEATLELGLAKLKGQREAAEQWLKRLGADRVEFGEPHFADQAEMDQLTRAQKLAAKSLKNRLPKTSSSERRSGVRVVLTAFWDIASMSAEETLTLLDRLRFEVAEDAGPAETAEEPPSWASPEEQLRQLTSQFVQPPTDEETPQFLFISRLSEEQLAKALAAALAEARRDVERLARAAELRLAGLSNFHFSLANNHRHEKMMERQRCTGLLAGSSYDLGENEIVSDDLRSAEFTVSVNVWYCLEEASRAGDVEKG